MDPRLQRRVQRYGWDRAVAYYDQYWQRQLEPAQTLLLEMAELKPGERVLDVACGTGLVTLRAAELVGPNGRVLGTDISQGMVDAARTIARRRGFENVTFHRADAEALGLEALGPEALGPEALGPEALGLDAGSFDAALCALGLMYVPDPVQALGEMRRAVKPLGRVAVAVWGRRDRCGWAEIFPIVDARVQSEVCPLFFQLGTGEALAYTMERAGLREVAIERISTVLHYETAEDAIGASFAGGPVALAYSRFDDRTREEAHAEYLTSIEPYRNGDDYEIPGEFVVARAIP